MVRHQSISADSFSLSSLYRFDIAGGVSDIPEIGQKTGVAVCNFTVEPRDDSGHSQCISITFVRNTTWIFEKNGHSLANSLTQAFAHLYPDFEYKKVIISSPLDESTGLGGSSIIASLFVIAAQPHLSVLSKIQRAHVLERTQAGIVGGNQDFLAAFGSGVNLITDTRIDKLEEKNLFLHFGKGWSDILDTRLFFIKYANSSISSDQVVNDEVIQISQSSHLQSEVKSMVAMNHYVYELLTHDYTPEAMIKIRDVMSESWKIQKSLSTYLIKNENIKRIEHILDRYNCSYRGPGVGINSMVFIGDATTPISELTKNLTEQMPGIKIYPLRIHSS